MNADSIDHAAEAREELEQCVKVLGDEEFAHADLALKAAQVHATLALVEEQRLANLIAYVQLLEAQYAEAATHGTEFDWATRADSEHRHGIALARIREGLGMS